MITIEQEERFLQDIMGCDDGVYSMLKEHEEDSDFTIRLEFTLDRMLDIISRSYEKYSAEILNDSDEIKIYLKICQFIKGIDFPYYRAFQFFFEGEYEKCLEYLKIDFKELFLEYSSDDNDVIDIALAVRYMIPFKNAFSGYWDELYKWISDTECTEEIKELCKAVQVFYESDNEDEIKESLEQVFLLNPQRVIVKEYLAVAYYYVGMWGNSVALFEQCDDFYGYYYDEIYFIMAWCYGKLGETVHEIEYYKKSYDMNPDGISTLNNLGYAYYKAKQYNKALEIFSECIDKKIDLKYATNNYVRTLLTMKRFKEAKQFAKNPPAKIAKAFLDRIKKADNTNKRIKADVPLEIETDEFSLIEGKSINKKEIEEHIQREQFSSEKILEDELTMRINAGMPVFSKKLKIYRKKGAYGRQFVLPNGKRLDLLCEDDNGELYIIELKKDSGYDDAYKQTLEYLEWFEKNWTDYKKVWGIICLNNPTKELLDKVHSDNRMKIYEYMISYVER